MATTSSMLHVRPELKVPNSATRAALAEADSILAKRSARFSDGEVQEHSR